MRTIAFIILVVLFASCSQQKQISETKETIRTKPETINTIFEFEVTAGNSHNFPSFAIWVEDLEGNYIETLYVTQYFAKGVLAMENWSPVNGKMNPVKLVVLLHYLTGRLKEKLKWELDWMRLYWKPLFQML